MIMACGLFEYNVHANTGDHYISVYPKGYNYSRDVEYGSSTTLELDVYLSEGNSVTSYEWQKLDQETGQYGECISTSSTYQTGPIRTHEQYRCTVTDLYGNTDYSIFDVWVENDLGIESYSNDIFVNEGDSTTLTINVNDANKNSVTYAWYVDETPIAEETSNSCTVNNISTYTFVKCYITDRYNNKNCVQYYIHVNNDIGIPRYDYHYIYLTPEEIKDPYTVTLNPDKENTIVSYTWYNNGDLINAATGKSCTLNITKNLTLRCTILDQYNNHFESIYYISIKNDFGISDEEKWQRINVNPGDDQILTINIDEEKTGQLTYTWYQDDQEIEGAASSSYTIENISASTSLRCEIHDQYGNYEIISYEIKVINDLGINEDDMYQTIYVSPHDTKTFTVNVNEANKVLVTYQWYKDEEPLTNETSDSYTYANIDKSTTIYCRITDQYNNTISVEYEIRVKNDLGLETNYYSYSVNPGDNLTLSVPINDSMKNQVEFTWSNNWETIENASSDSYTLNNIQNTANIQCKITDQYNNITFIYFYITIKSNWTLTSNGESIYAGSYATISIPVAYNGSTNLTVTANNIATENIHFTWYRRSNDYTDDLIEEYDNQTCIPLSNLTCSQSYYVQATDQYNNTATFSFNIEVNDLQISFYNGEDESYNFGETVTLSVTASAIDPTGITYTWYENDTDSEPIQNGTNSTYTITNVQKTENYYCVVQDSYGNRKTAWFIVCVNALSLEYEDTVYADESGNAQLTVTATSLSGSSLTYQWYDYSENKITGATSATYTITGQETSRNYYCAVTDEYGNMKTACIRVVVHPFTINYTPLVQANSNGEATLSVTTVPASDNYKYQWYSDYDGSYETIINGATSNSYTVKVDDFASYSCRVIDSYNNEHWAFFEVYNGDIQAESSDIATATPITAGQKILVYVADNSQTYIKFTPTETGTYKIYATSPYDTYASLLDATGEEIVSNDDGGDDSNFMISRELTANTVYYLKVREYENGYCLLNLHVEKVGGTSTPTNPPKPDNNQTAPATNNPPAVPANTAPANTAPANTAPAAGTALNTGKDKYLVTVAGSEVTYSGSLNKKATSVTIPDTVSINGITYKVTSIAANAFKNNQKIKKIVIGKNVKKIGANAFSGCKSVKSITIKTTQLKANTIGKNAFKKTGSKNYSKVTVKLPGNKKIKKLYKKILIKKGLSKKVKMK